MLGCVLQVGTGVWTLWREGWEEAEEKRWNVAEMKGCRERELRDGGEKKGG